jgi:hypothetical protein
MDTVNQIIDSLTAIGMIFAVVASFLVILTAGIQALRMKSVRWDALLFILVILWAIPIGLRYYGPQLMDASTDSILAMAEKSPRMREAIKTLLADVVEPWQEGGGVGSAPPETFPTAVPWSTATPVATESAFQPTVTGVWPTLEPEATPTYPVLNPGEGPATPTPDIILLATQNAAQVTPAATLDLDIWNPQTPPPTPAQ